MQWSSTLPIIWAFFLPQILFLILRGPCSTFANPFTTYSTSTRSCTAGIISVNISSTNIHLLFSEPQNQSTLTETIVELLQANTAIFNKTNGGYVLISGKYDIYSQLCLPRDGYLIRNVSTVQFLTHGDTLSSDYWDIAPGYSYVDAAVQAGYATFSYDRIGVGQSSHPDPIQVVQGAMHAEIAHTLLTGLRNGHIQGQSFRNVIGVGHSVGSMVTVAVAAKYPMDFDAIIITSQSASAALDPAATAASMAAFAFSIANADRSGKFAGLPNGYITQSTPQSIQFPFYRFPNYDTESKFLENNSRFDRSLFGLVGFLHQD